ncbi:MAG TPA: class I SAM-dependent methyltransferase [Anaerolineales bacterium]|nr:class I SAM-dependent methyltransferase [Anaerolineales bacterium]HNA88190.1 class I SAM-dependent methyltransferase [Anaerolineales bacterium]HNB35819.1 class I SAM-dependent methyltransferase [Anaerolineales bacterium]
MKHLVKNNRICAVCGGSARELLFQQKFTEISDSSILAGYDIVVCQTCGFCFADNLPDQSAFDVYYREMSKYEHQDRSGQASEFELRQFPALAQFIQRHIPEREARILEIGCANGGLLNALKNLGYKNLLGVDPSPVCARNAEQLYQIKVLTCALSDLKVETGPFNFIILVAVLEHIKDLESALNKLSNLLSPVGKIYIEVPDATQFTSSPDAPFQEFSIEHINFFSPTSLANLMGAYGFSEVFTTQVSYDQTDTHTGYAIRMVFEKNKATDQFTPLLDHTSESGIKSYIAASQKVEDRIHGTVNEIVDSRQPLIVWGVGTHTQRLMATSRLKEANIVAFVDSNTNYQGKQLNGVPIINPGQLKDTPDAILVSSRIFQSEIVHQIKMELKLENKIFTLYED